jgi:hypothetical protein
MLWSGLFHAAIAHAALRQLFCNHTGFKRACTKHMAVPAIGVATQPAEGVNGSQQPLMSDLCKPGQKIVPMLSPCNHIRVIQIGLTPLPRATVDKSCWRASLPCSTAAGWLTNGVLVQCSTGWSAVDLCCRTSCSSRSRDAYVVGFYRLEAMRPLLNCCCCCICAVKSCLTGLL